MVGRVRRVMVTVLEEGYGQEIAWTRRALSGQVLKRECKNSADGIEKSHEEIALFSLLPNTNPVVRSYIRSSIPVAFEI